MRWVVSFSVARCETGLPVFAVWAPTSHFAISLKSSLFQRRPSVFDTFVLASSQRGGGPNHCRLPLAQKKKPPRTKRRPRLRVCSWDGTKLGVGFRFALVSAPGAESLWHTEQQQWRPESHPKVRRQEEEWRPEITVQVKSQQKKSTQKVTLGFELDRMTFMLSEMFTFTWGKY